MMETPAVQETLNFETHRKVLQKSFFIALAVFIFCMIGTLVGWRYTLVVFEARKRAEFETFAKRMADLIERQVDVYSTILLGAEGLFTASESVERDEFADFVRLQNLAVRYPGILAMRFIQRVPNGEKEKFIQEVKADTSRSSAGHPDFSIKSFGGFKGIISPKSEYFVIKYAEPEDMLGFDVSSEPVRWSAYERAWLTGEVALSGAVLLLKGGHGFIVTAPIYRKGMPVSSFEEKRAALEGFVDILIETRNFFSAFFGKESPTAGIELRVFDGEPSELALSAGKIVFDSRGSQGKSDFAPTYQWNGKLEMAGRVWTLYFYATSDFQSEQAGVEAPVIALLGGSIFSFLLWGILYSLATSRFRAVMLAQQMTGELRENEGELLKALTDLRKTHTELRAAQSQLIQAEKAASITELAAGAAHEVKNPLAILLQGVNYLSQNVAQNGSDASGVLKEMGEAIKRADFIIKGLLNLARSTELVLLKENLNAIIEESLALVKIFLDRSHIKVVKLLDSSLPPLMLDKGKIIQVFINLFTNAAHVMPEGGTLTVKTYVRRSSDMSSQLEQLGGRLLLEGQDVVAVEVEDTGPGIHESILPKIFDPFFTTRRTKGGTGLGLSVTRNIVEMHGGAVGLGNLEYGKGARAVVVFPMGSKQVTKDNLTESQNRGKVA